MALVDAAFSSMTVRTCCVCAEAFGGAVALAPSRSNRAQDFKQNHQSEIAPFARNYGSMPREYECMAEKKFWWGIEALVPICHDPILIWIEIRQRGD
jgi:hypothetical protein